jgi:hypothetical protein
MHAYIHTQTVDECSALVFEDATARLRQAQYTWSSSDLYLDSIISEISGPRITISDVKGMQADRAVIVRVTVVDFFGVRSEEVSFTVTKSSTPVPKVRLCHKFCVCLCIYIYIYIYRSCDS